MEGVLTGEGENYGFGMFGKRRPDFNYLRCERIPPDFKCKYGGGEQEEDD